MSLEGRTVHVNRISLARSIRRDDVERAVIAVMVAEGIEHGEISVTFVEASAIATLNHAHLGRRRPTDVLAFNLAAPDAPLGDLYICPEVARRSARELGLPLREELLRLVIHGVLHVLGYDHPDGPAREQGEMFRRQEEILARLTESGP